MRVGVIAESLLERVALALGKVPVPIVEVFPPLVLARALMAATSLGVFDLLAGQPRTGLALATALQTDPRATASLLDLLVAAGYLSQTGAVYRLSPRARYWLSPDSAADVRPYLRFNYLQWDWLGELERFVRSGQPIAFHERLSPADWKLYEQGMSVIARLTLPEVVWRASVPATATTLLDLGGGHGLAAARFCQKHPQLRATVLDLPAALAAAPPLPHALVSVADRVTRTPGDALTTDLGVGTYDVIYVANLLHHFDAAINAALARRIAAALRPGGLWIIQDGVRERRMRSQRMAAAVGDLYFALTSASGFWSFAEMARWQADAGLAPHRPVRLITAPGQGLQIARKPRALTGGRL